MVESWAGESATGEGQKHKDEKKPLVGNERLFSYAVQMLPLTRL